MAQVQPDHLKGIGSSAKLSEPQQVEPRSLLDELVARKLSAFLAGETSLGDLLAAARLASREPPVPRRPEAVRDPARG